MKPDKIQVNKNIHKNNSLNSAQLKYELDNIQCYSQRHQNNFYKVNYRYNNTSMISPLVKYFPRNDKIYKSHSKQKSSIQNKINKESTNTNNYNRLITFQQINKLKNIIQKANKYKHQFSQIKSTNNYKFKLGQKKKGNTKLLFGRKESAHLKTEGDQSQCLPYLFNQPKQPVSTKLPALYIQSLQYSPFIKRNLPFKHFRHNLKAYEKYNQDLKELKDFCSFWSPINLQKNRQQSTMSLKYGQYEMEDNNYISKIKRQYSTIQSKSINKYNKLSLKLKRPLVTQSNEIEISPFVSSLIKQQISLDGTINGWFANNRSYNQKQQR